MNQEGIILTEYLEAQRPNTLNTNEYWFSPDALTITLNALENPQYLQVSLLGGSVILAHRSGVIDYDAALNFRKWTLEAFNNYFDRTEKSYVYIQLEKDGTRALVTYAYDIRPFEGTYMDNAGNEIPVFNVYVGTISAGVDESGEPKDRFWEDPFNTGSLSTDQQREEDITFWYDNFEVRTDANGVKYLFCKKHLVSAYSFTSYATPQTQVPSLFDGIPIDNDTIYWEETDGVRILKAKGGGGEEGTINEETLWQILAKPGSQQISSTHLTDALKNYITVTSVDEKISEATENFVTLDSEQEIAALKHFTDGLSVGAGKHKIYEKDGVVYFEGDLAVTGGITQYALGDTPVSTIMDGIVTDNVTIKKENGKLVVIGGSGSDFDKAAMWKALAADTAEQINKTHLTDALAAYATITDVDDRIDDLINGAPAAFDTLKEIADVLQGNVDSIGDIFEVLETKWTQDDTKIANWDAAFGWGNHAEAGYAHLANEEIFTGLKHFSVGLTVGEGKHKLYEKDGVVYFDGDLAVTGGITQYALGDTPVSTIMDGVVVDGTTISKEGGVLKVIGGSGGSFDSLQMWELLGASTTEQINRSHLTTALQGYATESWANSNFPTKLGNGASGTWGIDISGTAANANKLGNTPLMNNKQWWGSVPFVATDGTFEIGKYIDFHNANGESNDYSTRLQCSGAHVNIVNLPSGNGTLALLSDNVASATKLQTPRTLWGRSFDGTNNVTGTLSNVSGINFTGDAPYNLDSNANFKATSNSDNTYWHIDRYDGTQIIKILSSSGKMLLNHVDGVNFHNEGASCLDKNGNVKMTINSLNYYWCILGLDGVPLFVANSNTKNIGLGTDKPSQKLHVVGGTKLEGNVFFKNDGFKMDDYGNMEATVNNEGYYWGVKKIDGNSAFCVTAVNGNVGINITNPSQKLHVNGNILSTGGITQYSDSRAKTIIEQITLSLQSIAQSPAIRFRWNGWKQKDDGKTHIGGIAQYIQKILPEAIYNSDDVLTMDYATTSYIFAVNTAKHLLKYETRTDKEIKKLKKRIVYLEKQLKKLGYEETGTLAN